MFPKSLVCSIALSVASSAFAEPAYVPKFTRTASKAPPSSMPTPVAVVDGSAALLDPGSCPRPPFPKVSLRNEETGTTTIVLQLAPSGDVTDAKVQRSSGFQGLDVAAVNGMRYCLFKPAIVNGVQVASSVRMQHVWTLD